VLVIRAKQLDAFREQRRNEFFIRVLSTVRECWPQTYASRGEHALRAMIEKSVAEAEGLGIVTARDCARYVNLVLTLGDDFLAEPRFEWAARMLGKQNLEPSVRLDLVFDRVQALASANRI
jgi:hypothetical protein